MGKSARKKDQIAEQIYVNTKDSINEVYNKTIGEARNDLAKNNLISNSESEQNYIEGVDYFGRVGANTEDSIDHAKGELGTATVAVGTEVGAIGTTSKVLGTEGYNNILFGGGMNTISGDNSLDEKQEYNNKVGGIINDMFKNRDEALKQNDEEYRSGAIRAGIALREKGKPLATAMKGLINKN